MLLLQTKVVRLVRYGISKMCTSLIYFALCPPIPRTLDTYWGQETVFLLLLSLMYRAEDILVEQNITSDELFW